MTQAGRVAAAPDELADRWRRLRSENPGVRTRDAAATLEVSEAELLASASRDTVTRLDLDAPVLLHALPAVGRCMALTRNDHAVSEVRGTYGGVELSPHVGQVVGDGVDLRVFLDHWRLAFSVREPHPRRPGELQRSVQIFDEAGVAVHKVYLQPEGDATAWDALVERVVNASPSPLVITSPPARPPLLPDDEVDRAALVAGWDAMADTHEFFHLMRAHRVSRTQALRLAGSERARQVSLGALDRVLQAAARDAVRIMIFVGNRGCLQIYSGEIQRVVTTGPWLNVLDPEFNLHLREDQIAEAWVVGKPTRTGRVTSLEIYDAAGETIALVFRKRDDREQAEDLSWSALLEAHAGQP